jgi:nucleoside-diphosphate kinase
MSHNEYTLSIIKPDATSRDLTDEINQYFINNGLKVVAQKTITLTSAQAEEFYAEHKSRPFYNDLVNSFLKYL